MLPTADFQIILDNLNGNNVPKPKSFEAGNKGFFWMTIMQKSNIFMNKERFMELLEEELVGKNGLEVLEEAKTRVTALYDKKAE